MANKKTVSTKKNRGSGANKGSAKKRQKGSAAADGGSARAIRYAVVGLGYFAQTAVLPAFTQAGKNSRVTALVSDDPEKLAKLAKKYRVASTYSYADFNECLRSGEIDAVYIVLPNDMHRDFAVRAAKAGVHVLCEKPMAVTERDCEEMIRAANEHHVRLMVAYRLHLESANLKAIETIRSGKIGEPRIFQSAFTMQVKDENIRTQSGHGGGTVYDLGIYCINAARYLFREEPLEVFAYSSKTDDPRFIEVDEMTTAILKFPGGKLATFTSSFGAADSSYYEVIGTKGDLCLDQAYEFAMPSTMTVTVNGRSQERTFEKRDQVAAELLYFSDCALANREPEPSGQEGLADIRIIQAVYESAATGKPVKITPVQKRKRPSAEQEISRPPSEKPDLFHAEAPTQE